MLPGAGASLGTLVVRALTGATWRPEQVADGDSVGVSGALLAAGWTRDRLIAHRDAELAAGRVWPAAVPASERGEVGAAQLKAATTQVLTELGVTPMRKVRDRSVPLSSHDRVLMADRPPHHGAVG